MKSNSWMNVATVMVALVIAAANNAHAQKPALRVAVMEFTAAATGAEFEPLGAGLQSMITTDLSELPAFSLVERARLHDLQAELKLADSGAVDKATAAKLGALAGASHLLVGTFTVAGGKMRIDARLFAVQNGDVILTEKSEGAQTQFFELEKTLVKKIVDSVGVKLNKAQKTELAKPETTHFDAFQKFSQGIVLFDQKKTAEATASMQAAVAIDPGFALAATKLGEFQHALAALPKPSLPSVAQCKPNPFSVPSCGGGSGQPTVQPMPSVIASNDNRTYRIVVRADGNEASCGTPCQLYLPPGKVEVEVTDPVQFKKTIDSTGGVGSLRVTGKNKTNLIVGSALAAGFGAMLVASITLFSVDKAISLNTGSSPNQINTYSGYATIPLAIATGLAYPAVHFLLRIGSNDVRITTP